MLTITGLGFGEGLEVTLEGKTCEVTNILYEEIICQTPSMVSNYHTRYLF